jgi:hypothetical protein
MSRQVVLAMKAGNGERIGVVAHDDIVLCFRAGSVGIKLDKAAEGAPTARALVTA